MKLLTSEQQESLRTLLESISVDDLEAQGQINYWRIELKPKRTRKVKTPVDNPSE